MTDKGTIRLATVDLRRFAKAEDSDSWPPRLLPANVMERWKLIRAEPPNPLIEAEAWVGFYGVADISDNEYRLSVSIITLIRNAR